jgi:hypothetical protein
MNLIITKQFENGNTEDGPQGELSVGRLALAGGLLALSATSVNIRHGAVALN